MADLTTQFIGLMLPSPLIVGSSGLTDSVEKIQEYEKEGAGAVILKSIFEEEIYLEAEHKSQKAEQDPLIYTDLSESLDYLDFTIKSDTIKKYLDLISGAKEKCMIPIIASINCNSTGEWIDFAKKAEEAGADAIELNVFTPPVRAGLSTDEIQKNVLKIANTVPDHVKIPVIIKISSYFSNLLDIIDLLKKSKAASITLFNRFFHPDIDVNTQTIISSNTYTSESDYLTTLKWIGLAADETTEICGSTGVHHGETLIKFLLAGAKTVQVVSAIYKQGPACISAMLKDLDAFMDANHYNRIEEFNGKLSLREKNTGIAYERMQFMKNFSGFA